MLKEDLDRNSNNYLPKTKEEVDFSDILNTDGWEGNLSIFQGVEYNGDQKIQFTSDQQNDHRNKHGYNLSSSCIFIKGNELAEQSFGSIKIKDFESGNEELDAQNATTYLKGIFADYSQYNRSLFSNECNNWFNNNNKIFGMLFQRANKNKIPFAGRYDIKESRTGGFNNDLEIRLPIRMSGKFISISINLDDSEGYFHFSEDQDFAKLCIHKI